MSKYFHGPFICEALIPGDCPKNIIAGTTDWDSMPPGTERTRLESRRMGREYPYIIRHGRPMYIPRGGMILMLEDGPLPVDKEYFTHFVSPYYLHGEGTNGLWFVSEDGKTFAGPGRETEDEAVREYLEDGGEKRIIWLGRAAQSRPRLNAKLLLDAIAGELNLDLPMSWPAKIGHKLDRRFSLCLTQMAFDLLRRQGDLPPVVRINPDSVKIKTLDADEIGC